MSDSWDPMDCSPLGFSVHGFPGKEYWSGLHFPLQGISSIHGLNLSLLHCRRILYHGFFSCSLVPESLQPCGLQHARPPCPSPSPGVCSNSCPLSQWCHPIISSSIIPSSPAFNLSQHQGLSQCVSSSYHMAKVLELQPQCQSLWWIFRIDFL